MKPHSPPAKLHFLWQWGLVWVCLWALCSSLSAQVINIEDRRLAHKGEKLSGHISLNYSYLKTFWEYSNFNNKFQIRYQPHDRHSLLALNDLSFITIGGAPDVDIRGYQHLRYVYKFDSLFYWEAFAQNQFNRPMLIARRNLYGTGPRFRLLKTPGTQVYTGGSIMFEFEKEVRAEADTTTTFHHDYRLTYYLNGSFQLAENLKLHAVFYYLPRVNSFSRDYRVFLSANLVFKIKKGLSFNASFDFGFDSAPADEGGVPNQTYITSNGLRYTF